MTREYPAAPVVGVGVVLFDIDGRVLLVRRGTPPRLGEWSLPGGRQELGESVEACARRELLEETGCTARLLALVDVIDSVTRDAEGRVRFHYTLIDYCGVAHDAAARAGGDVSEVAWAAADQLETYALWTRTIEVIGKARSLATTLSAAPEPAPAFPGSRNTD